MKATFWHEKWEKNEIGFHEGEANGLLVKHLDLLELGSGSRIFLPLCGKTRDIAWLLNAGFRVAGAELSRIAVEQLFAELNLEPEIKESGKLCCYSAPDLDVFVGDMFDLSREALGKVDAVYDRAALVALPAPLRKRYSAHLLQLAHDVPQLLVTLEYDQSVMPGPPFSLSSEVVQHHYVRYYDIAQVSSADVPGGLKGVCPALESAWVLRPRR